MDKGTQGGVEKVKAVVGEDLFDPGGSMKMENASMFLAVAILLAAGSASAQARGGNSAQADIERALSAAPAAIARGAAVVDMGDDGRARELRRGDNGWTCLPRDPGTPVPAPVCLDQNGLAWFQAAMSGREPDPTKVGYSYMLKGGSVWSVVDPAATKLPADEKTHVSIPPHIMILSARIAHDSGFPSGAHPDTHKPFVVYGGTPYALLIIPVE